MRNTVYNIIKWIYIQYDNKYTSYFEKHNNDRYVFSKTTAAHMNVFIIVLPRTTYTFFFSFLTMKNFHSL